MGRNTIRKDDPWTLAPGEPDVRGWEVRDETGRYLGEVEDVLADADGRHAYAVVLTSGRQFKPREYRVKDGLLLVEAAALEKWDLSPPTPPPYPEPSHEPASGPGTFLAAFRNHFASTYPGHEFEPFRHAYEFGRLQATNPHLGGGSVRQMEEHLRALYEIKFPGSVYEAVRSAVRFGFEYGRTLKSSTSDSPIIHAPDAMAQLDRSQIRSGAKSRRGPTTGETAASIASHDKTHDVDQPRREDTTNRP